MHYVLPTYHRVCFIYIHRHCHHSVLQLPMLSAQQLAGDL